MSRPLIRFLIGGVQKGGTTALAGYLAAHPDVRLPLRKEAHVFDAPDFDEAWTPTDIDQRYRPLLPSDDGLCGDATPIYIFHPRFVQRIARYNPAMRWILLLRDPAERAISHYHMERSRGLEWWPLWAALLFERWRLRGHHDDFTADSPLRTWSYRARGDYASQLDVLYANFPAQQVLLLRSEELATDPAGCLSRVHAFLGLAGPPPRTLEPAFVGSYRRSAAALHLARWLLRRQRRELRRRYGIGFDQA